MSVHHAKAQALLGELADNPPRLPYEPTLLPELFAKTAKDSNASFDSLAELVNRSQGLATQVLRLANSAYYGFGSGISSLSHAMRVLGMNEVRNMVLALGVSSVFKHLGLPKEFPLRQVWEHQLLTASLAREITVALQPQGADAPMPDELYAAGLLHDIGKVFIASKCPDDWHAIAALANSSGCLFFQAEETYWGLDHSVVGARVLSFWQLPEKLTEPVGWHHAPELAPPAYSLRAKILAAANILSKSDPATLADGAALMSDTVLRLLSDAVARTVLLPKIQSCLTDGRSSGMASSLMAQQ